MLTGEILWPISPEHLANFPWPYVTLIFIVIFSEYTVEANYVLFLLANWTKHEKCKNPKGKGKLTRKYTIRVDVTVENLSHIYFS